MPWSDCADAQSDLGLSCPHMAEDTFSHGAAQLYDGGPGRKLSDGSVLTLFLYDFCLIWLVFGRARRGLPGVAFALSLSL